MRPLGISMKGANGSTGQVSIKNSTLAELVYEWNVWETQTMVFISFMLQVFLLGTRSLRRRKTNVVLKALIWLAYVGADTVAVFALGLFSQYEDRYNKLGRESFGDTLPFLWVSFLLVHLGGQDSITAFSLEDNNLWLRHLLNLATQGILALYVFWKSFHRINYSILIPAMFVYVSGMIKYGERVWALKSGSRNSLGKLVKFNWIAHSKESYALQIVLLAQGLFVGRTVLELGDNIPGDFVTDFQSYARGEEKPKMVAMELGMMFDLLYTKANVLQRWTGVVFRFASQALMVAAFLLFLIIEKQGAHNHNRVNVVITYTLFSGAMFMEACSVAVVMASPWTRPHLKEGSCLHGLCNFATSFSEAIHHYCNKSMHQISIGQFNYMDYCIAMNKSKPRILSKAIRAIGLDKQWRNLWYVHHAGNASNGIINCVSEFLVSLGSDSHPRGFRFGQVHLMSLKYTLSLPFEHALYRLHLYTDLHLSRYYNCTSHQTKTLKELQKKIKTLKEECQTLSNYMMYRIMVHPSMLPVSSSAEDFEPGLVKWFSRNHGDGGGATNKLQILEHYTRTKLRDGVDSGYPFVEQEQINESLHGLEQSLIEIKEMWVWLLMYAAGKCSGDLHARQLGEGGEPITFVWLLMMHHGIGDQARELSLFTSNAAEQGSFVSLEGTRFMAEQQDPLFAFNFHYQAGVPGETNSEEATGAAGHDGDMAPGGASTSGKAGQDDDAATTSEIDDQV